MGSWTRELTVGLTMALFGASVVSAGGCQSAGSQRSSEYDQRWGGYAAPAPTMDDRTITANILSKLADEAQMEHWNAVSVDTKDGVVYLSGTIEQEEEKARAEDIALSQPGVRQVINGLQIGGE